MRRIAPQSAGLRRSNQGWLRLNRPTTYFGLLAVLYLCTVLYWEGNYILPRESQQVPTVPVDFAELTAASRTENATTNKRIILPQKNSMHPTDQDKTCKLAQKTKFLIYVLPLPGKFNVDCIQKLSSAEDLSYKGVGRPLDESDDKRLRHTSHYSLEVIFHERLLTSRWVTKLPEEASAVYIPYYAGLLASYEQCRNGLTVAETEAEVFNHLAKSTEWQQCTGQRHIMTLSRPENFFLQGEKCTKETSDQMKKKSSLRCNNDLRRVTFVVPEHASTLLGLRLPLRSAPSVLTPYPSWVHLDIINKQPLAFAKDSERNILVAAAFDVNIQDSYNSQLRRQLREQLQSEENSVSSVFFDVKDESVHDLDWEVRLLELMRHTTFFLHPPGDSKINLKYFYDSVLVGCIPVVMMSSSEEMKEVLPFSDVINYKRLALHVPTKSVMAESLNIKRHLSTVTPEALASFRKYQKEVCHLLQYSLTPSETNPNNDRYAMDAFDMAVQRIESQFRTLGT